jgi:glycerophosphoryl diester phosphodiesterase
MDEKQYIWRVEAEVVVGPAAGQAEAFEAVAKKQGWPSHETLPVSGTLRVVAKDYDEAARKAGMYIETKAPNKPAVLAGLETQVVDVEIIAIERGEVFDLVV